MSEFRKVFGDGSKDDYVQYIHTLLKTKEYVTLHYNIFDLRKGPPSAR